MRCQPANAGPRKTSLSVSLPLSRYLAFALSFLWFTLVLSLSFLLIFSLSLFYPRRAGVHALSLFLSPFFSLIHSFLDTLLPPRLVRTPEIFIPPVVNFPRVFPAVCASVSKEVGVLFARETDTSEEEEERGCRRAACTLVLRSRDHTHSECLTEILDRSKKSDCNRECLDAVRRMLTHYICTWTNSCSPLTFPELVLHCLLHSLFIIASVSS